MENVKRYKVKVGIPSINGFLYEGTIVTVENAVPQTSYTKKFRCKDKTGKIWFLSGDEIELIEGDINE